MASVIAPERTAQTSALDEERSLIPQSVWMVDFVRVKSGFDLEYGRRLADSWKKMLDEQMKRGVVLSYKILAGPASNREDFTHMLMIEFPNYAALDQREKFDASIKTVFGSLANVQEMFRKREEVREATGTRLLRELTFKER